MAIPKPSEARLVIRHYEDGKMRVLLDGQPIPGVVKVEVVQDGGMDRSFLNLSIIGMAYRMETVPIRRAADRNGPQENEEPQEGIEAGQDENASR